MESPKKVAGLAAAVVVVIISLLAFYLSYVSIGNKQEAFAVIGLLSILFAIISYLTIAFFSSIPVVRGFVWAYYIFGVGSLVYGTAIVAFSVLYLILVLLLVLISIVFIYWRISNTNPGESKENK
ncbi:MAG: hypothetical protein M1267_00845 [Candidatus Thermoplasmatota archaeon]|jgi:hypothetical protein|nr:hypothetical protein [Candidatus Thermoplasmatota archaeon]MCL5800482.1 hypothetical protein [Candidatus Thermoplasmatota archaeon]